MAEAKRRNNKSSTRKSSKSSGRSSSSSSSRSSSSSSGRSSPTRNDQSMREVVIGAVEQVQDLIGKPVESVTGMEKNGSEWTVTLEVLELERIPNTTDILGKYEVTVDRRGEVTGAQRTRRYPRAEAGED
jgi:Gas vesicle synthesis protein GvpO